MGVMDINKFIESAAAFSLTLQPVHVFVPEILTAVLAIPTLDRHRDTGFQIPLRHVGAQFLSEMPEPSKRSNGFFGRCIFEVHSRSHSGTGFRSKVLCVDNGLS